MSFLHAWLKMLRLGTSELMQRTWCFYIVNAHTEHTDGLSISSDADSGLLVVMVVVASTKRRHLVIDTLLFASLQPDTTHSRLIGR